jgi:hypothetical protein
MLLSIKTKLKLSSCQATVMSKTLTMPDLQSLLQVAVEEKVAI